MKKILLFSLLSLLMVSIVLAQGIELRQNYDVSTKDSNPFFEMSKNKFDVPKPTVPLSSPDKSILLFSNGSIVTNPGAGPGGSNISMIVGGTFGSGFNYAAPSNLTLMSNFQVLDQLWTVDSIFVYGYQTGSTTTSTFTNARIFIYNTNPSTPGVFPIWADTTMEATRFTNTYRAENLTATNRPIMVAVFHTPGLTLPFGSSYWVEYGVTGSTTLSGPWCPPIAQPGDDLQRNAQTTPHVFTSTNFEFPVDIFGTRTLFSCPVVSNLNPTVIDMNTATFTWTPGGTESSWKVEYGTLGFVPGTGVTSIVTTPTIVIPSLAANTGYSVRVSAICAPNDTSNAVVRNFTTLNCFLTNLCSFSFNMTDTYGDGWNNAAIEIRENGVLTQTITMATGSTLNVPVSICNNTAVTLTWISGAYDDECGLTIKDQFNNTIFSFTAGSNPTANSVFYTFTTLCGATCPAPSQLNASNITPFTANLNWNENGTATTWDLEWGVQGFTPGTGTLITGITSKPYSLTGLSQLTNYTFYVRSNCLTELSIWSAAGNFTTEPDCQVNNIPFNEGFEGATFPPICWKNIDVDGDGNRWQVGLAPNIAPKTGTKSATSASWIQAGPLTPDNYLITPEIAVPVNGPVVLKFWVAAQDPAYAADKYSVLVSNSGTTIGNFTSVFTQILSDTAYQEITIPLDNYLGQNIHIAIRHHDCTDMFVMKIDDIQVVSTANIELSAVTSMKLYPNPTSDFVYISENADVQIFNIHGQLVGSYKNTNRIDVSNLNAGLYIFRINTENKILSTSVKIVR